MKKILTVFFALYASLFPQEISRLAGSPYPFSAQPDTLYKVTESNYTASQTLTITTLQGLLAQKEPKIFKIRGASDETWLKDLQDNYGVTVITAYQNNFIGLMNEFKSEISGYVLCNLNDNSVNVAISLCGITNSVAITSDNVDFFNYINVPMLADVRGKDEAWFFANYGDKINKDIFSFQKESLASALSDYSVFGKMMTLYNDSFDASTTQILDSFNDNAAVFGWGFDEYKMVEKVSTYDMYLHASDHAINLSTLANFNAEAKQKTADYVQPSSSLVHTVCFLMTDGDNIQWDLGGFTTDPKWYGSADRGKVSIGWTMSPAMPEVAPTVLKKIYDAEAATEKGRDYFVAGPSGIGYAFPENFKNMETFAARTGGYMKKADLSIVNILANNDSDAYLSPFLKQPDIDAIFYYFYSNYSGGAGKIKWVEGKPVIYGRYNLWDGFETSSSLAEKLNAASRNKYSADGYSLIPVHVWSRSVSDIVACAALLDSNVVVVTPDVFVSLIKKNLAPLDEALCFIPNGEAAELPFLVEGFTGTAHDTLMRWADGNDKIIYRFNKADVLSKTGTADSLQISFTVSNEYMVYTSTSLDGPWEEVARWSVDTTKHNHLPSNKREWRSGLSEYFNAGAENVYLKFEDGIKADAYGPKVYNVCIKKPQQAIGLDDKEKSELPKNFKLGQNYPNPFNPETLISYNLSAPGDVTLNIYDTLGRQVASLVNSYQQSGAHSVRWDGKNNMGQKVSSGVYLYRLNCNGFAETKKMVMLR